MNKSNSKFFIDVDALLESIGPETYYTNELGAPKKRKGDQLTFLCPFHDDNKHPNLQVTIEGEKKGLHYCFACEESGNIIQFYEKRHGVSFPDALKDLASKYAPHLLDKETKKEAKYIPIEPGEIPAILEKARETFKHPSRFKVSKDFELHNIYLQETESPDVLVFQVRYEKPGENSAKPEKETRSASYVSGKFYLYYTKLEFFRAGGKLLPYRGISLQNSSLPPIASGDTVFIVEGHKQVAAIVSIGGNAITSGGTTSNKSVNWTRLPNNLQFRIWPDNDSPGQKSAQKVANICLKLGHKCSLVEVDGLGLPTKGDVVDWLDQNPGATIMDILTLTTKKLEFANDKEQEKTEPSIEDWEEPFLFGRIEMPEIECSLLPSWVKAFAQAVTNHSQTPPGLAVMLALSTLSTCVLHQFKVSPYADTFDYEEPLILWTATVSPSGTRKTGVFAAMTNPISEWEYKAAEKMEEKIRENETAIKISLKMIETLEKEASKTKDSDERKQKINSINILKEEMPEEVIPPRFWTSDTTPEQMQNLLGKYHGRFSVLSDEGGLFDILAGLYSGGKANLDVFLKGHAAKAPLNVDRVDLTRTVSVKRPHIALGLTIQPGIAIELNQSGKKRFRGAGLLARFAFCFPKSNVGSRNIREVPKIPPHVKQCYFEGIFELLNIKGEPDENQEIIAKTLWLNPAPEETQDNEGNIIMVSALEEWLIFSEEVEKNLGEGKPLSPMADWAGKLPGLVLRIAGLCHVAENYGAGDFIIKAKTIDKALCLGQILIIHAQAMFDLISGDPLVMDAKNIFKWILTEKRAYFTRSECHLKFRGRFHRVDQLIKVLEILTERHIIGPPGEKKTKKPTIIYYINPLIFDKDYDHGLA